MGGGFYQFTFPKEGDFQQICQVLKTDKLPDEIKESLLNALREFACDLTVDLSRNSRTRKRLGLIRNRAKMLRKVLEEMDDLTDHKLLVVALPFTESPSCPPILFGQKKMICEIS